MPWRQHAGWESPMNMLGAFGFLVLALIGSSFPLPAVAGTVKFEDGLIGGFVSIYSAWTEEGLTVQATPVGPGQHFDIDASSNGGTALNNVGVIHRGNKGEQATVTYAGGAFNLLSVDIKGW